MLSGLSAEPFKRSGSISLFYSIYYHLVVSLLPGEGNHHMLAITNEGTTNVLDLRCVLFVEGVSDVGDFEFFKLEVLKHCLSSSCTAISSVGLILVWREFIVVL